MSDSDGVVLQTVPFSAVISTDRSCP